MSETIHQLETKVASLRFAAIDERAQILLLQIKSSFYHGPSRTVLVLLHGNKTLWSAILEYNLHRCKMANTHGGVSGKGYYREEPWNCCPSIRFYEVSISKLLKNTSYYQVKERTLQMHQQLYRTGQKSWDVFCEYM